MSVPRRRRGVIPDDTSDDDLPAAVHPGDGPTGVDLVCNVRCSLGSTHLTPRYGTLNDHLLPNRPRSFLFTTVHPGAFSWTRAAAAMHLPPRHPHRNLDHRRRLVAIHRHLVTTLTPSSIPPLSSLHV